MVDLMVIEWFNNGLTLVNNGMIMEYPRKPWTI